MQTEPQPNIRAAFDRLKAELWELAPFSAVPVIVEWVSQSTRNQRLFTAAIFGPILITWLIVAVLTSW